MEIRIGDLHRLSLMIQRMLDAELLLEEDGAALLAETDAARRSLEAGDADAARQHIERLAQRAEAPVQTGTLDIVYGHAVIEAVRLMTARDTD